MQNEYLVYTAIANLQTELRSDLKQVIQILEEIKELLIKSQALPTTATIMVDQERQSV